MKRVFYVFVGLFLSMNTPAISQDKEDPGFFTLVEEMPEYPGGDDALLKYIAQEMKYPEECRKNGIMGIVLVNFLVNSQGAVGDVKIVRSSNELFNKEALRVIKSIRGYKPGRQKGKPVPVQFTIPIRFALTNDNPESQKEVDKATAIAWYNIGVQDFSDKNYHFATYLFGEALKSSNTWFYEAFLARGKSYMMTNMYSKALEDFDSALNIEPQLIEAHLQKGKTYVLMNDRTDAIRSFQNALQVDSSSVDALQYLGKLHYANFEYDLALEYYERLVALDQTQGLVVYHSLGICYAKRRDTQKACEYMRNASALGIKEAELFVQNLCVDK